MVIVTGEGGQAAVDAMRSGAFDFVQSSMSLDAIELKIQRAMEHQKLLSRLSSMADRHIDPARPHGLLGPSPAMREVFRVIDKVAAPTPPADPGRDRHRQGTRGGPFTRPRRGATGRLSDETAPRSPTTCSRASCSGTRRAPSPAPTRCAPDGSSWPNDGTLFLDEWGT